MEKLIFILIVSFGSLFLGYGTKRITSKLELLDYKNQKTISNYLKITSLFILSPITIINAFWKVNFSSIKLISIPFLGTLSLLIGGTSAIILSKIFNIEPYKAGSIFTCSMFTNIGIFGSFFCFVLFGEVGFSIVQLYKIFEQLIYYGIGFPLSYEISRGNIKSFRLNLKWASDNPATLIPTISIVIGFILNIIAKTYHPNFLDSITRVLIPLITGMLTYSIGITLQFSKIKNYKNEIILIGIIRFLIIPAIVIPTAYLLGLNSIMNGIPFKSIILLSFLPSAFLAVVPPSLYDFDLDLANSGWIFTTFSQLIIFPTLYFLLV